MILKFSNEEMCNMQRNVQHAIEGIISAVEVKTRARKISSFGRQ